MTGLSALGARVMNVRLCFDVWHVAPYFVRALRFCEGGPMAAPKSPARSKGPQNPWQKYDVFSIDLDHSI